MNNRQSRVLESYIKILLILDHWKKEFEPEVLAVFDRLQNTIADIEKYRQEQNDAARQYSVSRARRQLEKMRAEQMLPLARLSRRVLPGDPRMGAAIPLPHKRA